MKKIRWILIPLLALLLFIPSYVKTIQQERLLSGVTIVLDSGHGGKDLGASEQGVDEAPLNLAIVKKLETKLKTLGCTVILTRKDENDLASATATNRKREDMNKRIAIINDEKNDLFISIHMNKYQSESVKGFHVFYKDGTSKLLASYIQENANVALEQDKMITKGNFFILNESRIQGVLIECGFLSNPDDRKKLTSESYQNKIVDCIADSLVDYFESKGMS